MNKHAFTTVVSIIPSFVLASNALAGGSSCGAWEVIATPNPTNAEQSVVRDIVAISPDDVWAVGGYVEPATATPSQCTGTVQRGPTLPRRSPRPVRNAPT